MFQHIWHTTYWLICISVLFPVFLCFCFAKECDASILNTDSQIATKDDVVVLSGEELVSSFTKNPRYTESIEVIRYLLERDWLKADLMFIEDQIADYCANPSDLSTAMRWKSEGIPPQFASVVCDNLKMLKLLTVWKDDCSGMNNNIALCRCFNEAPMPDWIDNYGILVPLLSYKLCDGYNPELLARYMLTRSSDIRFKLWQSQINHDGKTISDSECMKIIEEIENEKLGDDYLNPMTRICGKEVCEYLLDKYLRCLPSSQVCQYGFGTNARKCVERGVLSDSKAQDYLKKLDEMTGISEKDKEINRLDFEMGMQIYNLRYPEAPKYSVNLSNEIKEQLTKALPLNREIVKNAVDPSSENGNSKSPMLLPLIAAISSIAIILGLIYIRRRRRD